LRSEYEELFGESRVGRPVGPVGSAVLGRSGDTRLTEAARRRAKRVLVEKHAAEFEALFAAELEYLSEREDG
jgi:hypothetical protein